MPKFLAKKVAKTRSRITCLFGVLAFSLASISQAATIIPNSPEINAKGYILLDYTTGKVIAEGNADSQLAPASLTR